MRKGIFLTLIIIAFVIIINIIVSRALAISPTPSDGITATVAPRRSIPTPTPTNTPADNQIEKIKDLVASKVAQLKLVDKRGLLGKVKDVSSSQITLVDDKNKETLIDVDELTKFESSKESFGISDIQKGDMLSVIGLYNKETERLLARFVSYASNVPDNVEGVVSSVDKINYNMSIITPDGKTKLIDIETSTKTISFEDGNTQKSGFSKIEPGIRVIVIGFMDKKIADQINSTRIILLPQVSLSSDLKAAIEKAQKASPTPSPTPTMGKKSR